MNLPQKNKVVNPRERASQKRYQQEVQRKHAWELRAFTKAIQKADPSLLPRFRHHLQFYKIVSHQCPKLWEENTQLVRQLKVVEAALREVV